MQTLKPTNQKLRVKVAIPEDQLNEEVKIEIEKKKSIEMINSNYLMDHMLYQIFEVILSTPSKSRHW